MRYKTITKRIKYFDNLLVEQKKGVQGYKESIAVLESTKWLCHYTGLMLKKCQADKIPFTEYELKMRKNMEVAK